MATAAEDTWPRPHGPEPPKARALNVVREVLEAWQGGLGQADEMMILRDRISSELAGQANHELRQLLAELSVQTELARQLAHDGAAKDVEGRLERMMGTIDRARELIEAYLDPSEAAKLMLRIKPEPVALDEAWQQAIERFLPVGPQVHLEVNLDPVTVQADRAKLIDGLTFLVRWAHGTSGTDHTVEVSLRSDGTDATGFVGSTDPSLKAHELLETLSRPLDLADARIDLPYTRAVIERHGGRLSVERSPSGALGFGFRLPDEPTRDAL